MSWWQEEYGYRDDWFRSDPVLGDHTPSPDAILIGGPVVAVSRRGPIGVEWWAREWVSVLEAMGHGPRLERGRRYARNGSAHDLEIDYGRVFARVSGSHYTPYRTALTFQVFPDEAWSRALTALASQAIYGAKLLAGEMPADIEAVFQDLGLSLFPRSSRDVEFYCSCLDYEEPCKHAAALYYLLAEQLDADPLTLFHLHGRSREQVLAALHTHRGVAAAEVPGDGYRGAPDAAPLDADFGAFWRGGRGGIDTDDGALPAVELPGSDGAALRKLYELVADAARRRFGGDG
ncbi:MAG: SWIM zinc finger family protein [Anaerolineae bacterium]|nr:SWIM zinc finger family protein [Anaerolineae bacterium]